MRKNTSIMMQEIDKKANEKLNSMNDEEIVQRATKYKKWCMIIDIILGCICLLSLIVISVLVFTSREEMAIDVKIVIIGIFVVCSAVPFIELYRITKKSNKELALLSIRQEIKTAILNLSENHSSINILSKNFTITKVVDILEKGKKSAKLLIDNQHKKFAIQQEMRVSKEYNFVDLINYDIYENGERKVQGRAGAALIGGAFFGIGGMIVGSSMSRSVQEQCTQLKLIVRLNDIENPQITINYIKNGVTAPFGENYTVMKENLQLVCSNLEYIMNNKSLLESMNAEAGKSHLEKSVKAKLQEINDLLDEGLISKEEFEQMRKNILKL